MKSFYAWAVVDSGDKIDTWDWRVPIYWYRRHAVEERKKHTFPDSRVVKVKITEVKR